LFRQYLADRGFRCMVWARIARRIIPLCAG